MKNNPKWKKIKEHLKREPITGIQALNLYGVYRLSSIIHRMRTGYYGEQYEIETKMIITIDGSYAKYYMVKK